MNDSTKTPCLSRRQLLAFTAALSVGIPAATGLQGKKAGGNRVRLRFNAKPPLCPDCKDHGEVACNCGPTRRRGCPVCRGSGRMQGTSRQKFRASTVLDPLERSIPVAKRCTACDGSGKTACRFCSDGKRACLRCFGVSPAARADYDFVTGHREYLVWKEGTFNRGQVRLSYEGPPVPCVQIIEVDGTKPELGATVEGLDRNRMIPSSDERGRRIVLVSALRAGLTDLELSGAAGSTYRLRITPVSLQAAYDHAMNARSFASAGLFFATFSPTLDEKGFDAFLGEHSGKLDVRGSNRRSIGERSLALLAGSMEKQQPQFRSLADFGGVIEDSLGGNDAGADVREAIESLEKGAIEGSVVSRLLAHQQHVAFLGTVAHLVDRVLATPMAAPSVALKNEHLGTR
jgi:hypothetical protein